MIYEIALAIKSETSEENLNKIKEIVNSTLATVSGEILINEDWGVKTFAQALDNKFTRGRYFYFMYKSDTTINSELERRFRINEDIIRYLTVRLGTDADQENLVKAHNSPNNPAQFGDRDEDPEKDRRSFAKKRSCWFSANKVEPDWKNPRTYSWLVNEFGKISPARVTGLRPYYQRKATSAIKRGRCMGLISFLSNRTAYRD